MGNYKNKYAVKFEGIMNKTIEKWKKYESTLYDNTLVPICQNDPLLKGLIVNGKDDFPHRLWLVWVYSLDKNPDMSIDDLEKAWQNEKTPYVYTIDGEELPVVKGKMFEKIAAKRVGDSKVLGKLASALAGHLQHVGNENKREDFLVDDTFSIDIKYSGLKTDERFKTMIKPWGNDYYTATNKIQEGIIRSMYREGASQGQFEPKATGRTRHFGILKYDKKTGYDEVTQDDYNDHDLGPIPSLRKNILYIYNDDGYWASYCLKKVSDWAAQHIEDLGFTDWTREETYKSYAPNEFWGFSDKDWTERKTWYGSTPKD